MNNSVSHDKNIITGRAMASTIEFAREIINSIDSSLLESVDEGIQYIC